MNKKTETGTQPSVLIVTGMSGAGKTSALKALEDAGFEAVDNLPVALFPSLLHMTETGKPLAVGVDTRTRDFNAEKLCQLFDEMKERLNLNGKIVFFDCSDEKLLKRFTETRRSHPLAQKNKTVVDGIAEERKNLKILRDNADIVIDTTEMRAGFLKSYLCQKLLNVSTENMSVSVCSFSFRQGVPSDADLVFDVRFLRNPHYEEALRPLTGKDEDVARYIEKDTDFSLFFQKLTDFLGLLLPRYASEGKSYLTIAVGCTGGKHRSVYTAEKLYAWILSEKKYTVFIEHRALNTNSDTKRV